MSEDFTAEITNKVNCPYCGGLISNDVEICPECGERFKEPQLDNFKFTTVASFIVLQIITFGLFPVIWLAVNYDAFVKIAEAKDIKKLNILLLIFAAVLAIFLLTPFFGFFYWLTLIFISYRCLRIIEKFAGEKYGVQIFHHEAGMVIFNILYVVYFMETFKDRVNDPNLRYCYEVGDWIKYILIFLAAAGFVAFALAFTQSFMVA